MPRVLIIDDQKDVRAMVSIVLRVNHFDVVEAESGAAGLKAFGESVFDAAIVDIFLTDTSGVPSSSRALLHDLDVVVVDALRWEPHPTHLSVPQALELIADIHPRHAYLTHVGHTLEQAATNQRVGPDVEVAYDGLELIL